MEDRPPSYTSDRDHERALVSAARDGSNKHAQAQAWQDIRRYVRAVTWKVGGQLAKWWEYDDLQSVADMTLVHVVNTYDMIHPLLGYFKIVLQRRIMTENKRQKGIQLGGRETIVHLGTMQTEEYDAEQTQYQLPDPKAREAADIAGEREATAALWARVAAMCCPYELAAFKGYVAGETYAEIAARLSTPKRKVDVKSIDNALTRVMRKIRQSEARRRGLAA